MDIIKYFYEEPAALEVLAPDDDPDARLREAPAATLEAFLAGPHHYRGYLAGTCLDPLAVGLTAVAHTEAWCAPLLEAFDAPHWQRVTSAGAVAAVPPEHLHTALCAPAGTALLVATDAPVPPALARAATADDRRRALPALRRLLDVARLALLPEPAHDGHDWSLFSRTPLRAPLEAALRRHPHPDVRRFVLPFHRARSEEKFYFERYDLARFADFEV